LADSLAAFFNCFLGCILASHFYPCLLFGNCFKMSQTIQDNRISFQPNLNFLRISQRKLRRVLSWLIFGILILFGIYGVFVLIAFREYLDIFYLSLIMDMFVIYLWQTRASLAFLLSQRISFFASDPSFISFFA